MTNCPNISDLTEIREGEAECREHGTFTAKIARVDGKDAYSQCPTCCETYYRNPPAPFAQLVEEDRQARASWAGVPPRFFASRLENFKAENDGQRRVLSVVERFAESEVKGASLILCGRPGTGKTHLACGLAYYAINQHGKQVLFTTVLSALRKIKSTYRKDSPETEDEVIRSFLSPEILILDEIGVQVGSEHEKMLLFEIINERYQRMCSTILISNLTREELGEYLGERMVDRFREGGAVLAFDWDSYRGKAA